MDEKYSYNVDLVWQEGRKGILKSDVLPETIMVATPPEFKSGESGIWSPEHLFVASVSSCFMTTFLAIAEKSRLEFTSFSCSANGILEKENDRFVISTITLHPKLIVNDEEMIAKGHKVLELSTLLV